MHGRVKVKTTAEKETERRVELAKKARHYMKETEKVFVKRQHDQLDQEFLAITQELLLLNPDFYTLWNMRRECYIAASVNQEADELDKRYENELSLLLSCLKINPKSYGVWCHRQWIMRHMSKPDWSLELRLCTKYLEYDSRNFHCWDYRRFVAANTEEATDQTELDFTMQKIKQTFSNFSAWHYRSKLLLKLHPSSESSRKAGTWLDEELDYAMNAIYTDPNDQSAWLYHKWLLGRVEIPTSICCIYVRKHEHEGKTHATVVVTLSRSQTAHFVNKLLLTINGTNIECVWKKGTNSYASYIWIAKVRISNESHSIQVRTDEHNSAALTLSKDDNDACFLRREENMIREGTAVDWETLMNQKQMLDELYEIEPDNKWLILSQVHTGHMSDVGNSEYEFSEAKLEHLIKELKRIDPNRIGYYNDLRSKTLLEKFLLQICRENSNQDCRRADLSKKNLSCLHLMQFFSHDTELDLSHNNLLNLSGCSALYCLRIMIADNNSIKSLENVHELPNLEELRLKNNDISTIEDLLPLKKCLSLSSLHLTNNPICKIDNYCQEVKKILPQLKFLDSQSI